MNPVSRADGALQMPEAIGHTVGGVSAFLTSVGPQSQDHPELLTDILAARTLRQDMPKLTPIRGRAAQDFPAGGGENNPAVAAPYHARLAARRGGIDEGEDGVAQNDFWHSVAALSIKEGGEVKRIGRTLVMNDVRAVDRDRYISVLGAHIPEGGFCVWDGLSKDKFAGVGLEYYLPGKTDVELAESYIAMIEAEEANGGPVETLRWSDARHVTIVPEIRDNRTILLVLAIFEQNGGLPPPKFVEHVPGGGGGGGGVARAPRAAQGAPYLMPKAEWSGCYLAPFHGTSGKGTSIDALAGAIGAKLTEASGRKTVVYIDVCKETAKNAQYREPDLARCLKYSPATVEADLWIHENLTSPHVGALRLAQNMTYFGPTLDAVALKESWDESRVATQMALVSGSNRGDSLNRRGRATQGILQIGANLALSPANNAAKEKEEALEAARTQVVQLKDDLLAARQTAEAAAAQAASEASEAGRFQRALEAATYVITQKEAALTDAQATLAQAYEARDQANAAAYTLKKVIAYLRGMDPDTGELGEVPTYDEGAQYLHDCGLTAAVLCGAIAWAVLAIAAVVALLGAVRAYYSG